jgi:hypothetical protein
MRVVSGGVHVTAINIVQQAGCILVMTDGRALSLDGKKRPDVGKVAVLPHVPLCLAVRGLAPVAHTIAATMAGVGLDRFEKFKEQLPEYARAYIPQIQRLSQCYVDHELRLVGFSRERNRLESYFMTSGQSYAHEGKQPYVLYRDDEPMLAAPQPSPEAIEAAGFVCPEAVDFDPTTHGVALMDAQRRTHPNEIGAFVQVTTVTKDGVDSRVVKWWR